MNGDLKNSRPGKNDTRDIRNWVEKLNLKSTRQGDQFMLAAIGRALFTEDAKSLRRSLIAEAKRCQRDHMKQVKLREQKRKQKK